jgi:hypothetical protein
MVIDATIKTIYGGYNETGKIHYAGYKCLSRAVRVKTTRQSKKEKDMDPSLFIAAETLKLNHRNSLDLDLPIWTLPTRERPRMASIAAAVSLIGLVVVALSVSAA